ncbi:MAG: alpha/beta hydrolase [Betaproteobacteria bacterium]|nr:alpha/beta hydrolase [Betaproteobacteria bacterium]
MPVEVPDKRLRAFAKRTAPGVSTGRVTVYIESDGAPWRVPDEPPVDPTPLRPLVLRMAISDPSPAVAYLGRPCQYLGKEELLQCDPALWMGGRFRDEAVAAMSLAVDGLKRIYGAAEVNLVGYSGGGAMAALIAARRGDVSCLVTVAAPLDTRAWTDAIGVSPLSPSLNPADDADRLRRVPQTHFRGVRDKVVPAATTRRFLDRAPGATVIDKQGFDHRCCWDDEWKDLWRLSCLGNV